MLKDRLFEIRTEHGFTREEASAMIGVSHASWSNWESGRYNPSTDSIKQIADTFGVTKEWLETGLGEKTPKKPKQRKRLSRQRRRMRRSLATIGKTRNA